MGEMHKRLARVKNLAFAFGYSNVSSQGVLAVAGKTGREITTDVAKNLGLPIRPAMQQTITDGRLVDEVVTFISGNKLRAS
jgi:adenylosuccinate lyase